MTQQTRKPSFFRRLSLAPPTGNGSEVKPSKRAISGPGPREKSLGGPSYETMSAGPSAYVLGEAKDSIGRRQSISRERGKLVKETAPPIPKHIPYEPVDLSPTSPANSNAPSRQRIHPALASPPTSPPRLEANSPYGAVGQPRRDQHGVVRRDLTPNGVSVHGHTPEKSGRAHSQNASLPAQSPPRNIPRSNSRYADADMQEGTPPPRDERAQAAGFPQLASHITGGVPTPPLGTKVQSPGMPRISSRRSTRDTGVAHALPKDGVSEASAYAKAISSTLVTTPPAKQERRVSRPLPRPPSLPASSQTSIHVIASSRDRVGDKPATQKQPTPHFDFPRSPTLPPLNDPRTVEATPTSHLRKSIGQVRPTRTPPTRTFAPTLAFVLGHERVQNALLPLLPINSFLSLTGSSEVVRKRFSGEVVGRWILREWGITLAKERGRSWPNLTVWEGFLESLLHDPATYSTYPAQWHSLLQHLSLSYTLVVLHLRNLPPQSFPNPTPLPFDEEIPLSNSMGSLSSINLPRSRVGSTAGSEVGSIALGKMPRQERLIEVIMPEPLASIPAAPEEPVVRKPRRRGSIGSIASATLSFGRRRAGSTAASIRPDLSPAPSGKAALPPVSYPSAKRYAFTRHGDTAPRTRAASESGRPGSIFSVQSVNSVATSYRPGVSRQSLAVSTLLANPRASFASSSSAYGGSSPVQGRFKRNTPSPRREPAFDIPPPYVQGRAPVLRVFVPLSDKVRRWPSAEGALATARELDKSGASRRLRLGDLVVNTAIRQPKTTEHVLLFVPFVKHLFVPLEYTHSIMGHLPRYVDAFALAPSYFYPFLPTPQIVYLNLGPYGGQITRSLRLAHDRRDVVVSSGAKLSAKRYLHVAGFEVQAGANVAPEWEGTVSLEAEGTAEGKQAIESRAQGGLYPWEVIREKSMVGVVWLRLVMAQ